MKLTVQGVLVINRSVQEIKSEANTIRYPDRLDAIISKINDMISRKSDPVKILAYILRSFPVEQPFSNGNHRTAYVIFIDYSIYFGYFTLVYKITFRDEEFIRFVKFLTQEQIEEIIRRHLL
ncbi:MAG: Fic family protein [Candidatus Micrarchaeota archaeon]|nr:Fic family protein [Candidatus Micrarchaeota archaeon]